MSGSSALFNVFVACLLAAGALGCNKQCADKEGQPAVKNPENENEVISEIVGIINDVCKQGADEGTSMCNHTTVIPAGIFADVPVNVTLKYSDIQLDKRHNEFHQNSKGLLTASVVITYTNLTVTVEDFDSKVIINSTDNQFEITFTLKLPSGDSKDESDCFFEWNNIHVHKFGSSKTSNGPVEKIRGIVSKFDKEQLQQVLNSKPLLDFLNKEMSVCNKDSFLHDITSAFILILALKGLGSLIGTVFNDMFCT